MTPQLLAARYANDQYTNTDAAQQYTAIEDLGIRWHLEEFGITRVELVVRLNSVAEATEAYKWHLGHLIAVYDTYLDRPITCQVYEVTPDGRHVQYLCAGPAKRLYSDYLYNTDYIDDITWPSTYTNTLIRDIIEDTCPIVGSNFDGDHWASTGVQIGAWRLGNYDKLGIYPGTAIKQLIKMGSSDGKIVDFWLHDMPFREGNHIQKPWPYLQKRNPTSWPIWQFWRQQLAADGLTLSRHIWDLATYIKVGYGRLTGTHTGSSNNTNLIDSAAQFIGNVTPGDSVINITQTRAAGAKREFTVHKVISSTELEFEPVTAGDWDLDDRYSIALRDPKWTTQATSANYWVRTARPCIMSLDQTQADYYRDLYLATYKSPVQQQAFVLSSPVIYDAYRQPWPLWRPLFHPQPYFRMNDIIPEIDAWTDADNRKNTFLAVAMDYTYRDNRLRIVPATYDNRLDILLNQWTDEQNQLGELITT